MDGKPNQLYAQGMRSFEQYDEIRKYWIWHDPDIIPIEPDNNLYYLIEKISNLLTGSVTLFFINDIIADEALDKRYQPMIGLAISGRHRGHSLCLLT